MLHVFASAGFKAGAIAAIPALLFYLYFAVKPPKYAAKATNYFAWAAGLLSAASFIFLIASIGRDELLSIAADVFILSVLNLFFILLVIQQRQKEEALEKKKRKK